MEKLIFLVLFAGFWAPVNGQKQYASTSALASGKWVKIGIKKEGVYKVTGEMLFKNGMSDPIKTNEIRLYGNGGSVLPESAKMPITDDLNEVAVQIIDGGDGKFDASDYFLFYGQSPQKWVFDSSSSKFNFLKNPYSSQTIYFITLTAGNAKRIVSAAENLTSNISSSEYDEHFHHELDSINFLKSGKEWYGEEMSQSTGILTRSFAIPFANIPSGKNIQIQSELIGRSNAQSNTVNVMLNGTKIMAHNTLPLNGTLIEPYATISNISSTASSNADKIEIKYEFVPGSQNASAWINWFELFFRRSLIVGAEGYIHFQDLQTVGKGNIVKYSVGNSSSNLQIWDVSSPSQPISQKSTTLSSQASFTARADNMHEFVAFEPSAILTPDFFGTISNQNLHAEKGAQMIIVSDQICLTQAERLANFHRTHDGMSVLVVNTNQIFNEFSSGSKDPTAIRNFIKMMYDRAGQDISKRPQHLLLFGSSSYIFKGADGDKFNSVPSYQSGSSLDPLTSYVTDDYFGFLDDDDDINNSISPLMDISIGRLPARNASQATMMVDKIISYHSSVSFGEWRNMVSFVADDEDYNIHLNDAEDHSNLVKSKVPALNIRKIYLDAFQQESGSGGSRYPLVNESINKAVNQGTLIWNYSGHGGSIRLAQEDVLDKQIVSAWTNENKLPLFITATCDFAPFDDPTQISLGEDLLNSRHNGAIGLLTTTRMVFASSNKISNNNFLNQLLTRDSKGKYPSLGKALADSKNTTVVNSGDYINARKFVLLGDPAMKLAIPEMRVAVQSINGKTVGKDTLKANATYLVKGEVQTPQGLLAADFNGRVFVKFYAQPTMTKTLGNDAQSRVVVFEEQKNILYQGIIKVTDGLFNFSCNIPTDLPSAFASGKLSFYAEDGKNDASGYESGFIIGGRNDQSVSDLTGPSLRCYLNDSSFVNGKTVDLYPKLKIDMYDSSGINISGLGLGHDITATLDNDFHQTWFLNDLFEPSSETTGKGQVSFEIPGLEEGQHALEVRVWDNFNNSSKCRLDFKVVPVSETKIEAFKILPNPSWDKTLATFVPTGLAGALSVEMQILTEQGRIIKSIQKAINTSSGRSIQVEWDGTDESGKRPQKGMYYVRLVIRNSAGKYVKKVQKLILM